MNIKPLLLAATVALAGCSHITNQERAHQFDNKFSKELFDGYVYLADWENEQGDFIDANMYEGKVKALVAGQTPTPEVLDNWDLPVENLNELAQARNFLTFAMAHGAAEKMPEAAAEAQWRFDCWVEQQEENFQPEHIKSCKEAFKMAEAKLRPLLAVNAPKFEAPAKMPVSERIMPNEFIVFFDFDTANLGYAATNLLNDMAEQVSTFNPSRIVLAGHADRSGNEGYNMALSVKRANAVANYLVSRGVPRNTFVVQGLGEDAPRVSTVDGVRHPENRYVTIRFIK